MDRFQGITTVDICALKSSHTVVIYEFIKLYKYKHLTCFDVNPDGRDRFQGTIAVDMCALKSSPTVLIYVSKKVIVYNVNIYGGDRFEGIHTPQRDRLFH